MMIKKFVYFLVLATTLNGLCAGNALAQRPRRTNPNANKPTTGGGTQPTTRGSQSVAPSTSGVVTVPQKVIDTLIQDANSKEYGAKVLPSLRNNYAYEKGELNQRTPLAYDVLREDDAGYSVFVWREIDAREKMNLPFTYGAKEDNRDQRFFSIMLDAIKSDSVVAFSADDDRFTTPLEYAQVLNMSSAKGVGLDTSYVENVNDENVRDTIIKFKENKMAPKPDSVYKFRIKEQYVFDKETSKMYVRIIGIAPLAPVPSMGASKTASKAEQQYYPLFWLYYPDLRKTLAKTFVYNPKNSSARMSWEDLFEGRMFASYIVKSSLDNPKDQRFKDYIKDPLFQLVEGENVKEKIFNYEQSLWSY